MRLAEGEIDAIAAHMGLAVRDFIDIHTELTIERSGLTLKEKADGSCSFLTTDNLCLLEAVKPKQCRDFPRRWRVEGIESLCPGWRSCGT